ncbi:hypothetical protein E05_32620 [Plautia stali symbiont]|nr:hypothetical protein E05_32620 [Plautia stali symbiont]
MAFRLLRYSVAAMQRHLEQGNDTLPVVIPLLFYHGTISPYPYTTQWFDCFIAQAGNTIDGEGFIRALAEKAPTYREDFMTIAEQLEARGEARGIQLGKQEGYQLGRQDGVNEGEKNASRKIAQQLLANGAERNLIKISTGLSEDELDKL